MRYWHQTWMPLWGHPELLARSDQWFIDRLSNATAHATYQGYKGARWGKMLGENNPHGLSPRDESGKPLLYWESPNDINPVLVWHQPHIVYMAELQYQAATSTKARDQVLQRLKDIVLETAAFIGDFPVFNENTKTYDLGPPVRSAPEANEDPTQVWNPAYELIQFNFSLDVANSWRERLGLPRNSDWDHVRGNLSPLPTIMFDGKTVYNGNANCNPGIFTAGSTNCAALSNHPAFLGAVGAMPGEFYGADVGVMNATLATTVKLWGWDHCWGWDEPLGALTATRLQQSNVAIDLLMLNASTNQYCVNGANCPHGGMLSAYFPGNGGLLITIGMMAAGWSGAPNITAPGFPKSWNVKTEGFNVPYF